MMTRTLLILCLLAGSLAGRLHGASAPDLEDRTRELASELRCVVCQNLSVADSPSEMAQQMRAIVREQLEAGKTPDEIRDFFVSKYGEWVLLKPKTSGFSALLWILPYAALALGVLAALFFTWRWSAGKARRAPAAAPRASPAGDDWLRQKFEQPDLEDNSRRAELIREWHRLVEELRDLVFDFDSGKISEFDYGQLRTEIESKGSAVVEELNALPPEAAVQRPRGAPRPAPASPAQEPSRYRAWQLVAGGAFLLLFGLALGIMLTQSVRPRAGENDTMTGDFLTGTTPAGGDARSALAEGKSAFANQDFPKAIDSFKRVLAADPGNPEAHSYMGFILLQAGHGDGALLAFDKALERAPNLPMALWGRGLVLYREKNDYAGARETLEKLLTLVPPGEERNEIAKVLAEIPATGVKTPPAARAESKSSGPGSTQISGRISVDPRLKEKVQPNATLFIIARPAGAAAGPPLAVKRIDKPAFPLEYTLGQENVMMQGAPFAGKIKVAVRLDRDGDAATRGAGDLVGEHKGDPVEAGAKNVDIVIDQEMR